MISAAASLDPEMPSSLCGRQGYSLPTLMGSLPPSVSDLRMDILILSSFLDCKQSVPSTVHPVDKTLALYSNISTLLAIGNSRNARAQNVNVVMGTINMEVDSAYMEFVVCTENPRHKLMEDKNTTDEEEEAAKKEVEYPDAGKKADEYGGLSLMFPAKTAMRDARIGRDFLDKWDTKKMNIDGTEEDKYVLVICISTINCLPTCSK